MQLLNKCLEPLGKLIRSNFGLQLADCFQITGKMIRHGKTDVFGGFFVGSFDRHHKKECSEQTSRCPIHPP